MNEADLPRVARVEAAAHVHPWNHRLLADCLRVGYIATVCESVPGGEVIGHAIVSLVADECHILNLCIDPSHQGSGQGARLLSHMLETCRQKGAERALLEVRASNRPAIALYERFGFSRIGERPGYYPTPGGDREDALVLEKALED